MIMMAMNATDLQAQGVVPAQKGEKTFTLEDLNFASEAEQATTEAKVCTAEEKANGNGKQHDVAGRTAGNAGTGNDHRVPAGRGN